MRLARGFFRLWVILAGSWVALCFAVAFGSGALSPDGDTYQYLPRSKTPDGWWSAAPIVKPDLNRPYYDLYESPSQRPELIAFYKLSSATLEFRSQFKQITFDDGTDLLVPPALTEADVTRVSKAYWEERFSRRRSKIVENLPVVVGWTFLPPLFFLAIGFVVAWIARGFKRDTIAG